MLVIIAAAVVEVDAGKAVAAIRMAAVTPEGAIRALLQNRGLTVMTKATIKDIKRKNIEIIRSTTNATTAWT